MPAGNWRHSRTFEDVGAAIEAGMTPSAFWLLPEQDQAYLIAYHRAKSSMVAYENHLHEKEMDRQSRQANAKRGR